MLAPRSVRRTVGGMAASFSSAPTAQRSAAARGAIQDVDVLASVAEALGTTGHRQDWAVLEAWACAVTLVTGAALQAVPEELHDFL
jgi:hypothetical protein